MNNDQLNRIVYLNDLGKSNRYIGQEIGISPATVSKFLTKGSYKDFWKGYKKPIAGGVKKCPHLNPDTYNDKKLIILTCAQNNTYVHKELLASLEVLKERYDGEIIVSTCTYNKSGFQGNKEPEWFDPAIVPFIRNDPLILAEGLQWRGELNILPTASKPLDSFKVYTGLDSLIIPHVKAQTVGCAVRKTDKPKFAYTTGAITQRNYIQKTAGQKASFNHIFGALVVEIDKDGTWFAFRINAESDTGNFYLHDTYYTPEGYTTGHNIAVLNGPDAHICNMSDKIAKLMYHGGMLDEFKPKYFIWNDTYNGTTNNRHEKDNPRARLRNFLQNTECVKSEVKATSDFLYKSQRPFCTNIINYANHDTIVERWADEEDWRDCKAVNMVYLLECQLRLAKNAKNENYYLFESIMQAANPGMSAKFLRCDESFEVLGIEMGSHGHIGISGSRGTDNSFVSMGLKFNKGHTHRAFEFNGVYCAGVSNLEQGYNKGGTCWSVTAIVTYTNGKRSLYTERNGKYKAEYHCINGKWRKAK